MKPRKAYFLSKKVLKFRKPKTDWMYDGTWGRAQAIVVTEIRQCLAIIANPYCKQRGVAFYWAYATQFFAGIFLNCVGQVERKNPGEQLSSTNSLLLGIAIFFSGGSCVNFPSQVKLPDNEIVRLELTNEDKT